MDRKMFLYRFFLLNDKKKNIYNRTDGRIEWICEHGVGHTIYSPNNNDVHGCDGCCSKLNHINNQFKIVVLNGVSMAGKDTFVEIFKSYVPWNVINYSTVDGIKRVASELGWNGEKTPKDRMFFRRLKQLLIEYNNIPFKETVDFVKTNMKNMIDDMTIFIHIREKEEIEKIVTEFPSVLTVLIENDRIESTMDAVYEYDKYTWAINNSGTIEELRNQVVGFIESEFSSFFKKV